MSASRFWQWGGCRASLWEEAWGFPGSTQVHNEPLPDTAEPATHTSKMCLRKGGKHQRERRRKRKSEKQQREHQNWKRRCSVVPKVTAACGGPTLEQILPQKTCSWWMSQNWSRYTPKETAAHRGLQFRKGQQREAAVSWPQALHCLLSPWRAPVCPAVVTRREKRCLEWWSEAEPGNGRGKVFSLCINAWFFFFF